MNKFLKDFKDLIVKSNVISLALGISIGASFGRIITSLVNDIIMPFLAFLFGGQSIKDWKWILKKAVYDGGILISNENALNYGAFIQTIIDFLLIAFSIFLIFKLFVFIQKRINEGVDEVKKKFDEDRNKLKVELKSKGLNKKSINDELELYDCKKCQSLQSEGQAKVSEQNLNTVNMTDKLLTEIRDLLKSSELETKIKQDKFL
ncbi:MAG: large conductance mechanosensitive channel protein MscL [Clostridiales bacterium]|jgi:large conductance mechanosensitive channel|nr:large conductance mechanosensitive channel protein MscL [Clostridiales bacterium]